MHQLTLLKKNQYSCISIRVALCSWYTASLSILFLFASFVVALSTSFLNFSASAFAFSASHFALSSSLCVLSSSLLPLSATRCLLQLSNSVNWRKCLKRQVFAHQWQYSLYPAWTHCIGGKTKFKEAGSSKAARLNGSTKLLNCLVTMPPAQLFATYTLY